MTADNNIYKWTVFGNFLIYAKPGMAKGDDYFYSLLLQTLSLFASEWCVD